ncbi:MAG: FAS1-like dehydratase domain-containing protein [Candidatus Binatia bacterium]
MSGALPLGLDRALLGSEFDSSISEPVSAEQIREFAEAAGETNPAYRGEIPIATPMFCIKFRGNRFFHPSIPHEALLRGFDAGKDMEFGAPIRAGDVIHMKNVLHEVYEKTGRSGSMVFLVSRQTMTNQNGELVARIDSRFVLRPGKRK